MFERFTDRARKVFALADREAQRLNHECISTEHVLLGLIEEGSGQGVAVLTSLGFSLVQVRREVEKHLKSGPDMVIMGKLPQAPRVKRVIELAIEESRSLSHGSHVGTEHLLLGLLREEKGIAAHVLKSHGITLDLVRERVLVLSALESLPEVEVIENPTVIQVQVALECLQKLRSEFDQRCTELEQALRKAFPP